MNQEIFDFGVSPMSGTPKPKPDGRHTRTKRTTKRPSY